MGRASLVKLCPKKHLQRVRKHTKHPGVDKSSATGKEGSRSDGLRDCGRKDSCRQGPVCQDQSNPTRSVNTNLQHAALRGKFMGAFWKPKGLWIFRSIYYRLPQPS